MTCAEYDQPPEWWYRDDISDQQRAEYMMQWRACRQAMRQDTAW